MVDRGAINHLCVEPVGSVKLVGIGGATESPLYPVRLSIVLPPNPPLVSGQFANITAGPLKEQGLLCLLGRDVLQHALFVYDGGGGHVSVAF
jgi:hypothetical protein